jgi:hypothetical protein
MLALTTRPPPLVREEIVASGLRGLSSCARSRPGLRFEVKECMNGDVKRRSWQYLRRLRRQDRYCSTVKDVRSSARAA